MPCCWIYEGVRRPKLKVWRYPGVPIPWRLQDRYYDPTVKRGRR